MLLGMLVPAALAAVSSGPHRVIFIAGFFAYFTKGAPLLTYARDNLHNPPVLIKLKMMGTQLHMAAGFALAAALVAWRANKSVLDLMMLATAGMVVKNFW